jgi:hypothetical protein
MGSSLSIPIAKQLLMATITNWDSIQEIIANDGRDYPMQVVKIVQYTTPEGDASNWGIVYSTEVPLGMGDRYDTPSQYVHNPKIIWTKEEGRMTQDPIVTSGPGDELIHTAWRKALAALLEVSVEEIVGYVVLTVLTTREMIIDTNSATTEGTVRVLNEACKILTEQDNDKTTS